MIRTTRPSGFLSKNERDEIVAAIGEAESKTSGEIRVHLDRRCKGEAREAARKRFEKLRMHATAERNGVLLYVAVKDRKFAVIGDKGIDEKVGAAFWDGVRDRMGAAFRDDRFGEGIAAAISEIGVHLATAFPRRADDVNELSNDISLGTDGA